MQLVMDGVTVVAPEETMPAFDANGLVPCVVQDAASGMVLMVAWMNAESFARTLVTGTTWFWSRSRGELWNKGATSGNVQHVAQLLFDCDRDTLLALVVPEGPACHTGATSCFYRQYALPEGGEPAGLGPAEPEPAPPQLA